MPSHPLVAILSDAAAGEFPPRDGAVLITGPPPGPTQAVVSFTASHVIATSAPSEEIRSRLDPDDLGAALGAGFLSWLGERIGRRVGSLDVVLAAPGTGSPPDWERIEDEAHARVRRALRYRDEVAVYRSGPGTIVLGNGLAGRREVAVDVERPARDRGRGTLLAREARGLVPEGSPLFAQVAPGNAASLRAFLAAGYRIIGAEVLFPPS